MASAARTAKRVVAVTKGEAENSTDVDFQSKLNSSSSAVTSGKLVCQCPDYKSHGMTQSQYTVLLIEYIAGHS